MKPSNDLIRMVDDVEVPEAGRWTIPEHQPVALCSRRPWRRRAQRAVASGTLTMADDPLESMLELVVEPADGPRVDIRGRLVATDPLGDWRMDGTAAVSGSIAPVALDVRYHGVFRHAERAMAWLTVRAAVPLRPGRRGPLLELDAELNAERGR